MADKPCRWVVGGGEEDTRCTHPLSKYFSIDGDGEIIGDDLCHGCPCHEPQASVVKESLTAQPDPTPTGNCRWWKDEYGNWCCSCSDTLPGFTPWPGTDPNGGFCPNCGKIITVRVHDKP